MPTEEEILQHHFPTPEDRNDFYSTLAQVKVGIGRGDFGETPEEQSKNVQGWFKKAYPHILSPSGVLPGTAPKDTPAFENFPQFLANKGINVQEKNFGQQAVYPGLSALTEAGAATGGAIGGALLTPSIPFIGGVVGAGVGGGLHAAIIDPGLRAAFGLPQKGEAEYATDIALSTGLNAGGEFIGRGLGKLIEKGQRYVIFGQNTPPPITPQQQTELALLRQGGRMIGQDIEPGYAMLSHAPRPGVEPPKTFATWFADTMNTSLGGSNILQQKVQSINHAYNALFTDAIQKLGQSGALTDSSIAAETIKDLVNNRVGFSRNVKGAIYSAFAQMPGAGNDLPVEAFVNRIRGELSRLEVAETRSAVEARTGKVGMDFMDYLIRKAPVTQQTPVGTAIPSFDVSHFSSYVTTPLQPGSTHFAGFDPQSGQALITAFTTTGQPTLPMPFDPTKLIIEAPISTYAQMHELRSVLLEYGRRMQAASEGSRNTQYGVQSRIANGVASEVTKELDNLAHAGHIPRTTILAGRYADSYAKAEADTFLNEIVTGITAHFRDNPEQFAQEMLKPHNASDLIKIKAAIESTPDVAIPHAGMSEGELRGLIQSAKYRKALTAQGKDAWNQEIIPQMQAEVIRSSLKSQSEDAFTWGIEKGQSMSPQAFRNQATRGRPWNPDDFVAIDGAKLVSSLESNTLDPRTRQVVWGSQQNYDRWLNIAKLIEKFDSRNIQPKAGIGSFMSLSRQGMGIGLLTWGGINLAQGKNIEDIVPQALGGGMLLTSPIVLASYINNPNTYRQLIIGLKQTPPNFYKSRIARSLALDSIKQYAQERERAYPVNPNYQLLPGENR